MSEELENIERHLVLDTETTGFDPETGDKITEIAVIELIDRKLTGRVFHEFLDPGREVPDEVVEKITQLTREDLIELGNGQKFSNIAHKLQEFFDDFNGVTTLVAHNAKFDMNFINWEMKKSDFPEPKYNKNLRTLCTLNVANNHPQHRGKRNSLDAIAKRYGISDKDEYKNRKNQHGALIDTKMLVEVFLEITVQQKSLHIDNDEKKINLESKVRFNPIDSKLSENLISPNISKEEEDNHNLLIGRVNKESDGDSLMSVFSSSQ